MKQENSEIGKKVLTDGLDHCRLDIQLIAVQTSLDVQYKPQLNQEMSWTIHFFNSTWPIGAAIKCPFYG